MAGRRHAHDRRPLRPPIRLTLDLTDYVAEGPLNPTFDGRCRPLCDSALRAGTRAARILAPILVHPSAWKAHSPNFVPRVLGRSLPQAMPKQQQR
jgi:hypothetical protein